MIRSLKIHFSQNRRIFLRQLFCVLERKVQDIESLIKREHEDILERSDVKANTLKKIDKIKEIQKQNNQKWTLSFRTSNNCNGEQI